ncbi:MAG: formimidoylglutamate deiminase [Gammaproteobacteria bacterium]|nr:formimidoylglutamate deiminase [Gammaproteobacteria bacterium]
MPAVFARKALIQGDWARNVRLHIDAGRIARVDVEAAPAADESVLGIVVPGLPNAHSHAFQRALAGHAEYRGDDEQDTFWTWRERMYRLAGRIDAAALAAIARQAYIEMLSSGYTAVAEFHYLHREPGSGDRRALFDAVRSAADETGIRLTYVPVLYERAGFDNPRPQPQQHGFALSIDEFLEHYEEAKSHAHDGMNVAIGVHSLRAVCAESLARVAAAARSDACPMHIHIAEQQGEVDQCLDALGLRPIEWLLENAEVDSRWCLVHATHMTDQELERLSATGAIVCLCPSTEANLGDGLFALRRWLSAGGRIAIGSDSHISINPFEELRWLEYGQRLKTRSRNVAAIGRRHTGRRLFELAAEGGALACGLPGGELRARAPADFLVLDDHNPMLSGHSDESILDALVFSGFTLPIDRVMVDGNWQLVDGRHRSREYARSEFNRVVRSFLAAESGS